MGLLPWQGGENPRGSNTFPALPQLGHRVGLGVEIVGGVEMK